MGVIWTGTTAHVAIYTFSKRSTMVLFLPKQQTQVLFLVTSTKQKQSSSFYITQKQVGDQWN